MASSGARTGSLLCISLMDPVSYQIHEMHVCPSAIFIQDSRSSILSFSSRHRILSPITGADSGLRFCNIHAYGDEPTVDICNGVFRTGRNGKAHLLTCSRPRRTVGDCLLISPNDFKLTAKIPEKTAHAPKVGDILLVDCLAHEIHTVSFHNPDAQNPSITNGYHAVLFLPEIHDMARFQRTVLDNAAVLRELGHSIGALVGCFTVQWDLPTRSILIGYDDLRTAEFIVKEYPALEALYCDEEEMEEEEAIAARLRSRKRKSCNEGGQ